MEIQVTSICEDTRFGGYDVNLTVSGKEVAVWVNDSFTEVQVVKSRLVFYMRKEIRRKLLSFLYQVRVIDNMSGNMNVKVG